MKRVPLSLEYTITFRLLDSRIHPADTQVSRGDGAQQRCRMRSRGVQCCWRCRLPGPRPRASPAALKRNERPAHGPGQGGERERGRGKGAREWEGARFLILKSWWTWEKAHSVCVRVKREREIGSYSHGGDGVCERV